MGDDTMKRLITGKHRGAVVWAAIALCMGTVSYPAGTVMAEEAAGYFDDGGNWVFDNDANVQDITAGSDSEDPGLQGLSENAESTDLSSDAEESRTGTYTVCEGWSSDENGSTQDVTVYRQEGYTASDTTSTITCSYLDTNYSVLEYEQLRDMLTNNLIYSNVNAQISASAVYTNARDFLYILIADDAAKDYLEVYYYVVGDYRCFCVNVKEYRAEAESARSQERQTPQEVGKSIAEGFVWN